MGRGKIRDIEKSKGGLTLPERGGDKERGDGVQTGSRKMCQHLLKRQGDKGVQGLYACARHLHLLFPRVFSLSYEKKKDFKISRTFLKNRKLLLLLFSH